MRTVSAGPRKISDLTDRRLNESPDPWGLLFSTLDREAAQVQRETRLASARLHSALAVTFRFARLRISTYFATAREAHRTPEVKSTAKIVLIRALEDEGLLREVCPSPKHWSFMVLDADALLDRCPELHAEYLALGEIRW